MKYFLSVGEASGDIHAAALIDALRHTDNAAEFVYLGGDLMHQASGVAPLIHYSQMAYMGFSEVIRHLPQVLGNLRRAKESLEKSRPDALILVDYPSFNLKLARHAQKLGIPVYYYISPKVWAWKEYRVKDIKRYVRRLFSILPFEVQFFKKHDYDVTYVGNPSVEEIEHRMKTLPDRQAFLDAHQLPDRPILALVPGSRQGEIRNNLPIMVEVAQRYPQFQAVVAGAPGIDTDTYRRYADLPVVTGATFELMRHAEIALVTSGTATLEAALLQTPQVVCYRANGSKLSYNLFKHILKINYVSLPNLISDKAIVPEMLLHHCNADEVSHEVDNILPQSEGRKLMIENYCQMRQILGDSNAANATAEAVYNDIKNLKHT